MKKTITLSLLATSLCLQGIAQDTATYPYDYAYSTQEYTPLDNPTQILGSTGWDYELMPLTFDFNFRYKGEAVTEWLLDTYGGIYLNGQFIDDNNQTPAIVCFFAEYVDNGNSSINYQISGTEGSQILKIEFDNVGIASYEEEIDMGHASYQIWLYEASNQIEFHVGPNEVDPTLIDLMNGYPPLIAGLTYEGATDQEVMIHVINNNDGANTDSVHTFVPDEVGENYIFNLTYGPEYPDEGSVFTFIPQDDGTGIQETVQLVNDIYPNPATDRFTLELKAAPAADALLTISTITGSKVASHSINKKMTAIDISHLAKGVYLLNYTHGSQHQAMRIIKK